MKEGVCGCNASHFAYRHPSLSPTSYSRTEHKSFAPGREEWAWMGPSNSPPNVLFFCLYIDGESGGKEHSCVQSCTCHVSSFHLQFRTLSCSPITVFSHNHTFSIPDSESVVLHYGQLCALSSGCRSVQTMKLGGVVGNIKPRKNILQVAPKPVKCSQLSQRMSVLLTEIISNLLALKINCNLNLNTLNAQKHTGEL